VTGWEDRLQNSLQSGTEKLHKV